LHGLIAVDRLGAEITAKGRLGVEAIGGHEELAPVAHEDRLVVGDHLGKERQHKERQKQPQRPEGAAVGLEVAPAARVER